MTTGVVLDASALLALLGDEPGADVVRPLIPGGVISTVNWTEVAQAYAAAGLGIEGRREQMEALGLSLVVFSAEHAEIAAGLWAATRRAGLSLADRACMALAMQRGDEAVTANRAWESVQDGPPIRLIR